MYYLLIFMHHTFYQKCYVINLDDYDINMNCLVNGDVISASAFRIGEIY